MPANSIRFALVAVLLLALSTAGHSAVTLCPTTIENSIAKHDLDLTWMVIGAASGWQAIAPGSGSNSLVAARAEPTGPGISTTPETRFGLVEPPLDDWDCVRVVLEAQSRHTAAGDHLMRFTLYSGGKEITSTGTAISTDFQDHLLEIGHLCGAAPANLEIGITGFSLNTPSGDGKARFELAELRLFVIAHEAGAGNVVE